VRGRLLVANGDEATMPNTSLIPSALKVSTIASLEVM
jgi:hypothetical protein